MNISIEAYFPSNQGLVDMVEDFSEKAVRGLKFIIDKHNIAIDPDELPILKIDLDGVYPTAGLLASGAVVSAERGKTVFFQPQTLAVHAQEFLSALSIQTHTQEQADRLIEYCLFVSVVDFILQSTNGVDEEHRHTLRDAFVNLYF